MAENGWAFEKRCADILTSSGWVVEITPGSGDFGVDLIANRGGTYVAIQCKRWSTPVSNKAVQEAYAGRGYYSSTHAAVVSLSGYTKAAEAQAARLRVRLLTLDDLEHLHIHLQTK
jgi:restriction system protein